MSKMADIQRALEQTQARPVAAPALTVVEPVAAVVKPARAPAPSREGRIHIGAYLPEGFKRNILMLRAATGEDLQSLLARCLNEQFRLHGLPEISQD
jgi:hypothetical protein